MGSRTGRFTRNDSVQPISVANTWDGSFLLESNEQKLRPGHRSIVKAEHGGDPETMLPLAVEQGHRRPARIAVAGDVGRRRSRHSMSSEMSNAPRARQSLKPMPVPARGWESRMKTV
jgi:hypothetical protein